jgi:hypothetical protein
MLEAVVWLITFTTTHACNFSKQVNLFPTSFGHKEGPRKKWMFKFLILDRPTYNSLYAKTPKKNTRQKSGTVPHPSNSK